MMSTSTEALLIRSLHRVFDQSSFYVALKHLLYSIFTLASLDNHGVFNFRICLLLVVSDS